MNYFSPPVINFATLDQPHTLRTLDKACREWGVFQLVGHDIGTHWRSEVLQAMAGFFALPREQKKRLERTRDNPWGYYDSELTNNTPDWKEIYDYGPGDGGAMQAQWPESPSQFRAVVSEYYEACESLCFVLLDAISGNLGASPGQTGRCFRPEHTSFLRFNHYPVCDQPASPEGDGAASEGYLGINPHTDAGALTLLLQDDQAGLEIFRDQHWHRVAGGGLLVHLGDIVQVWSNDRYRSPVHRVASNSEAQRFSAPFFFNPTYETNYQPLPATVDAKHPPQYRSINWGEFRRLRADGDYGNYGDEVQIQQYRLAGE